MLYRAGSSPGWEELMGAIRVAWVTPPHLQGAQTLNSRSSPVLPTWPPPFPLCRAGPTMNMYTQASGTTEDASAYYRSNTMATGQAPKYQAF